MSSFAKRGVGSLSFVVAVGLLLASGCSATPKGSLMLAISTDMQTPKDISLVSIFIAEGSTVKFDYVGRVLPDGTVSLPSTLALVEPDDPSTQIQIRVIGFNEQTPRVLRDVQTTVPHDRTALLRLPLNFLDLGSVTGQLPAQYYPTATDRVATTDSVAEGDSAFDPTDPTLIVSTCDPMHLCQTPGADCQTMINGVCGSATVVSSTLPVYTPTEVYGEGGVMANGAPASCFPVQTCFAEATPVTGVGAGMCSFTLPSAGQSADAGARQSTDGGAGQSMNSATGQPMDAGLAPAADAAAAAPTVDAATSVVDGGVSVQSAPISLTAPNINVALVTPGTGACVAPGQCYVPLPNDPVEGWTLQGNTVTLAPGPCMKLGSTVTVAVSGACATDTISQPVCEPTTAAEVAEAGAAPSNDASAPTTCDGNYVITCVSNGVCGANNGGSAALTVSGAQATLYAPMSGNQIVPITGSVDTATCVATITLPSPEAGSCDSAGGTVMAALTSGASFAVPCTNGGNNGASCVQGTMSCTAARGTLEAGDGGAAFDSGAVSCPGGTSVCGNTCADTSNDPNNCGACGKQCPATEYCAQGLCAQLLEDAGAPPLDATTASDASTTPPTCPSGFLMCNGTCVNQQIDPNNCGTCAFACLASQTCVSGACTVPATSDASLAACTPGMQQCLGNGFETCQADGSWGAPTACTTTVVNAITLCSEGACTYECNGGFSACNGACVDEQTDNNNCGGCGNTCTTGFSCSSGTCATGSGNPMDAGVVTAGSDSGSGTANAVSVSVGEEVACALISDGTVQCWGDNTDGELGNGTTTGPDTCAQSDPCSPAPVAVTGLTNVTAVSVGAQTACALLSSGTVQCWGENNLGQLGNGTTVNSSTPVPVAGLNGVTAISVGVGSSACALLSGGTVQCWGANNAGQLGDNMTTGPDTCGSTPCSTLPVAVGGLGSVTAISVGGGSACALLTSGTVSCWGNNLYGQLGNGGVGETSPTPVAVSGLEGATAISVGGGAACALLPGGVVECWGWGGTGALCDASTGSQGTPVAIGVSGITSISVGGSGGSISTCAMTSTGIVECWGFGALGALGNGSTGPDICTDDFACSTAPVQVSPLPTATLVSVGNTSACALVPGGNVECWGDNSYGELGAGITSGPNTCDYDGSYPCSTTPVAVQ